MCIVRSIGLGLGYIRSFMAITGEGVYHHGMKKNDSWPSHSPESFFSKWMTSSLSILQGIPAKLPTLFIWPSESKSSTHYVQSMMNPSFNANILRYVACSWQIEWFLVTGLGTQWCMAGNLFSISMVCIHGLWFGNTHKRLQARPLSVLHATASLLY